MELCSNASLAGVCILATEVQVALKSFGFLKGCIHCGLLSEKRLFEETLITGIVIQFNLPIVIECSSVPAYVHVSVLVSTPSHLRPHSGSDRTLV